MFAVMQTMWRSKITPAGEQKKERTRKLDFCCIETFSGKSHASLRKIRLTKVRLTDFNNNTISPHRDADLCRKHNKFWGSWLTCSSKNIQQTSMDCKTFTSHAEGSALRDVSIFSSLLFYIYLLYTFFVLTAMLLLGAVRLWTHTSVNTDDTEGAVWAANEDRHSGADRK